MEIKITTTTKKLTKSLVSQMTEAGSTVVKNGTVIGYLVNVVKNDYKSALIEYAGEYYTFSLSWDKGEVKIYRKIGKWTRVKDFKTKELCSEFWEDYKILKHRASHHTYI